jgi:hypothetical protein
VGCQLTAEHICLLIAAVAATVAAWLVDASNPAPNDALRGLDDMARVIACLAGCGYLIRSAETRTRRAVAAQLADAKRARREGYAAGFVDGTARKLPTESGYLRSVT